MSIAHSITTEIADKEESDPLDLPPLYETIDPNSLQELIESSRGDTLVVEFTYFGYGVRVTGNGTIEIAEGNNSQSQGS